MTKTKMNNAINTILQDSKINHEKLLAEIAANYKKEVEEYENKREMFTYNKYTNAAYYHGFNN